MIRAAYVSENYMNQFTKADCDMLDVINIAFGHVRGNEAYFERPDVKTQIQRIRDASGGRIRIILSIGGWGAGGFSNMAKTDEGRKTFAKTCADLVKTYELDGIDIDWEYPTIDWANIDAAPEDHDNFTTMLQEIRNAIGTKKQLSIAIPCGEYFVDCVEMDKLNDILDYISLMSYDMRCVGTTAGHHTALYPQTGENDPRCAVKFVNMYSKYNIPREKMILGAALYSRIWHEVEDSELHGLGGQATKESGDFGPGFADLKANYINKNGFKLYYDNGAPYLYNAEKKDFISFDDENSVKDKVRYIKENNLAGLMYWEHSCDETRSILKAINEATFEH